MKSILIASAIFASSFFAIDANAQAGPAPVRARQANQQGRIREGVRDGELTRREAARLEGEQIRIQQEKKAAKADGVVTPAERAVIRHDQNKASRDIHRAKNNARVRR